MGKLRIYGDKRSGNCLKVKWTAEHLGVDYEWIDVDVLSGTTRTEEFLALNPSGQVPAVILSDGRVLTQSNAIIVYLAGLNNSALLPSDLYTRAKVDEWLFWEQYSHEPCIAVRRFQKSFLGKADEELDPQLLTKGRRALGQMELALQGANYLVGDVLTVADIALVAYTRVAHEGGFELSEFPAIRQWVARVERDLLIDQVEAA
ncbi:glutathione S-transferase family protein [Hyphococcus flavus]|uniref:Glutathione S-transferase family protein n=1 Tax=Hyphococcus flavus TaxID=1866326 RepID=A0AAF0CCC8_9PROT|nr:glutathione S-transferase family protein [Hyphococcus flavus]WDI33175.1 glutathione S-transferase family protein [Hyphococcus flavus]